MTNTFVRCFSFSILLVGSTLAVSQQPPANPEVLVWSDEFNGAANSRPDPVNWTYDVGASGWGNKELETYCAWASNTDPCNASSPNAYVGGDGYLHIVARAPRDGVYTSARLKSDGLKSFQYGRIEARIKIPEGQGIWPAFWMLPDDIATVGWPAAGEIDIMENIGKEPSIYHGSLHMTGSDLSEQYSLPHGAKFAAEFHIYGMLWTPGHIQFYVDSPANIFATFNAADLPKGAHWPFDSRKFFVLLNVAVGGSWPGSPDATIHFPQEMLVDYVRVYSAPAGIHKESAR
jgi:beta-glucanase (GH16 family)